ncbi:MAG: hypothetical protein FJ145_17300 [Deltaproteobacteria bacterium]|nr:hypothetical protein [Deltaproteobacteria bacterium]
MSVDRNRVAQLVESLNSSDKPKIRAAVDALTPLALQSEALRSQLEGLLNQAQSNRWPIAYILGQLPEPSGAVIRSLLAGLDHREPDIRWAIALLLNRIAKSHGELVTWFMDLLTSGTVNQKRMAIYCLRDLELEDAESLLAMVRAVCDVDATVRVAAITSLKRRRDAGASERDDLLQRFLHDDDLRVRNAAAITLANLGSPSVELMQALQAAAAGENAQLKKSAEVALAILYKQ